MVYKGPPRQEGLGDLRGEEGGGSYRDWQWPDFQDFPRFPLAQMPLWGGMGREVLIVMCGCTTTVSKEVRCFGQSE